MSAAQQLDPRQSAVEEVVASWPEVRAKQVFGHRGYVRGGKMFAFIADEGVSVKTFSPKEAEAFYARAGVAPFVYKPGMEMTAWPVLPLRSDTELDEALSAARRAYEAVA
jgi:TfoX/Sxy family transcriptional regulator of competence genes